MDSSKKYRLREVAKATDISKATLSSWLARGHIELNQGKGDRETAGTGDQRLFSWHRVINIAIVAELSRLGIPPAHGTSRLALKFSDVGGTVFGAVFGDAFGEEPKNVRRAGDVCRSGGTWFVVRNFDGELEAEVSNAINEGMLFCSKNKTA